MMLRNVCKSLLGLLFLFLLSFQAHGQQYSPEVERFGKSLRRNEQIFKEYRHPKSQDQMIMWGRIATDWVESPLSMEKKKILFVYLTNLTQSKKTAKLASFEVYHSGIPKQSLAQTFARYRQALLGQNDIYGFISDSEDFPIVINRRSIGVQEPMGMSRNSTYYVDLEQEQYLSGSTNTYCSKYDGCAGITSDGFIYYHMFPLADGWIYGQYVHYDRELNIKEIEPIHLYGWCSASSGDIEIPSSVISMTKDELRQVWENALEQARSQGKSLLGCEDYSFESVEKIALKDDDYEAPKPKIGERIIRWQQLEWHEFPKKHKMNKDF